MALNSTTEGIVPTFCCAFEVNLRDLGAMKSPNCKGGSIDLRVFMTSQVSSVVGDILDLMCGPFKSVQQCENKAAKIMKIVNSPLPSDFDADQKPFLASVLKAFSRLSE